MRGASWILTLALLARATPGRADDGLPLDLTWSAPAGCASAEDIERELARIARVRPGRTVARLSARGRIERLGTSYRLSLHTEQNGVAGERSLVAKECRSLEREVTLVLAVAFGQGVEIVSPELSPATTTDSQRAPSSGSGEGSADDASSQPTVAASGTTRTPTATKTPEASRTERLSAPTTTTPTEEQAQNAPPAGAPSRARFAGFLEGGVLLATLPSAAAVVAVGSELGIRRFWIEPRFEWIPHVSQSLDRGVRAFYNGFGGSIAGCLALPPYSVGWNSCLGGEAFALRGRSTGASESPKAVAPLVNGIVSLGWEWPAHGTVAFRLDAALHIAFDEPRFVVEGLGEAHKVPRLSPSLAARVIIGKGR